MERLDAAIEAVRTAFTEAKATLGAKVQGGLDALSDAIDELQAARDERKGQ